MQPQLIQPVSPSPKTESPKIGKSQRAEPAASSSARRSSFSDELARSNQQPQPKPKNLRPDVNSTPKQPLSQPSANQAKPLERLSQKVPASQQSLPLDHAEVDSKSFERAAKQLGDVYGGDASLVKEHPILSFISGRLENIDPADIPELVTGSAFLSQAINQDSIHTFMNTPTPIFKLLKELDFSSQDVAVIGQSGIDLKGMMTPKDLLSSLGIDAGSVTAELQMLKDNLPLDGLRPYMERAAKMYRGPRKVVEDRHEPVPLVKGSGVAEQGREALGQGSDQSSLVANSEEAGINQARMGEKPVDIQGAHPKNQLGKNAPLGGVIQKQGTEPKNASKIDENMLRDMNLTSSRELMSKAPSLNVGSGSEQASAMDSGESSVTGLQPTLVRPTSQEVTTNDVPSRMSRAEQEGEFRPQQIQLTKEDPFARFQLNQSQNPFDTQKASQPQSASLGGQLADDVAAMPQQVDSEQGVQVNEASEWINPANKKAIIDGGEKLTTNARSGIEQMIARDIEKSFTGMSSDSQDSSSFSDGSNGGEGQMGSKGQELGLAGRTLERRTEGFQLQASDGAASNGMKNMSAKVFEKAQMLVQKGGGSMVMEVNDHMGGKIELAVKVQNDQVLVKVMAANDQMRDVISGEAAKLRDALSAQNLDLKEIEVGTSKQDHQSSQQWTQAEGQQQQAKDFMEQRGDSALSDRGIKLPKNLASSQLLQNIQHISRPMHSGQIQVFA